MKKLYILFVCLIPASACYVQQPEIDDIDMEAVIGSADVLRTEYPDSAVINLYQGNGRFGCSYGPLGLHNHPADDKKNWLRFGPRYGHTRLTHMSHFVRDENGRDYLAPLVKIYWEEIRQEITNYSQKQSNYEGTIQTQFDYGRTGIEVLSWFDPVDLQSGGIMINAEGNAPDIIIEPLELLNVYQKEYPQEITISELSDQWKVELHTSQCKTELFIKTTTEAGLEGNQLKLGLKPGTNVIHFAVNQPVESHWEQSLAQSKKWWNNRWENSGIVVIPDSNAQKTWVRSMYQFFATYNTDKLGIQPPMGFAGNLWNFNFPQDIAFIHPVLLSTGNFDIAKAWVEQFSENLDNMRNFTDRLLETEVDGILCPWGVPYGDFEGFLAPVKPSKYYYATHNSGYLARMAYETAALLNDEEWTTQHAVPLIRETALFYKSICSKREDGYWHLSVKPSIGQDENGGINQDDYLCSLFSARYCFQKAIEYGLDDGTYKKILEDGLAFPTLLSKKGYYYTCSGTGEEDFGTQKHPVQLNGLAFLPVYSTVTDPSATAYDLRYKITYDAEKPLFWGWTAGEFLLAGSRTGDVEGWKKDWDNIPLSNNVDPGWIQFYESSNFYEASFYTTTNGLVAQSLLDNLVSDWFGRLEIARCNPWEGEVLVRNIYLQLGVKVDGTIDGNNATILLTAWKDCEFELFGESIQMDENDQLELVLDVASNTIKSKHSL